MGREQNDWLPVPTGAALYLTPSAFKSSAVTTHGNDTLPFTRNIYETSPTERLKEQYGSGAAWHNAGRSTKTERLVNATDSSLHCIRYVIGSTGNLTGNTSTLYAPGELSVEKITDEDRNVSYTFCDKQGRTLLNRQMDDGIAHDTYYVYDDLGQLRFVLQPMYQQDASLDRYAFQYRYDARGRCIRKKLPGADYTTYTYDHADRISKVEHTLDGTKVTLTGYTYDTVGRLSTKSLHGSASNKLTYGYNVRGWLTGISSTKFTQSLTYGNGTAGYNGNITATAWTANGSSHSYAFAYDGLNRLTSATHGASRFTEKVTSYDKNGNILALQRYGQTAASAYGLIDNLTLTYNGNQLTRADDAVTASAYGGGFEFKDGVKQANEYAYDANGNLTKDLNKNISSIQYNCLNLPSLVTFGDGSTITYTYAADGAKLRTVHKIGGTTTTTDYCGDVVYENGVLKLLLTEAGYVTLADKKYHYYLQDHQGNSRVVLNQSGAVEEVNHYYPFGGVFASTGNVQPYKYNGKELDVKKGLNWYDYGARHYDAALGRFLTVDPMAETNHPISSYTYCLNNPIKYIDPTGCLASTHTDSLGNVVDVYNDGDLGVYRHNTDFEGTKQELAENHSSVNTAAGGERMGKTAYWDEFLNPATSTPYRNMRVMFNRTFDAEFADYAALAAKMDIVSLAKESRGNGKMDIKKKVGNIGALFRGKYVTSRSLGNYLAGYNAANANISFNAFQKLAGALHIEENYGNRTLTKGQMLSIILFGTYNSSRPDLFVAPLWGEVYYQFRMSKNGWQEGIR